jgi:hypothetical protein
MKLTLVITVLCVGFAGAQPYELDWTHKNVDSETQQKSQIPAPAKADKTSSPVLRSELETLSPPAADSMDEANFSRWRQAPPVVRERVWPKKNPADEYPKPVNVSIEVDQNYDHYNERYRLVSRVESWVYRGSYPQNIVHCNRADYESYTVYLNDLEKGDRFEVQITWDDGSRKTLYQTMNENPKLSYYVSQPDYSEYRGYSEGW